MSAPDPKAARWWLVRRFELDAMEQRLVTLHYDAVTSGDAAWAFRLDVARRAITLAVKEADDRAAQFMPDEAQRRELRVQIRAELLGAGVAGVLSGGAL